MREQKVVWPLTSGHCLVLEGQPSYWWLRMLCTSLVLRESQQCRVSMPLWCGTIPLAAPAQAAPWLMHRIDDALLHARAFPRAGLVVITSTPPMMWLVNDPLKEASAVALASIAVFMGGFSASACGPSIRWAVQS